MRQKPYNTTDLAELFSVKANSIRSAICRTGRFMEITPRKLSNGRLYFYYEDVQRILHKDVSK